MYRDPLNDVLKTAYTTALGRDAVTITRFTTGEEYEVFFRTYSDNRSERNVEVMYFSADDADALLPGTTFSHNDTYFIILNGETPENSVYRKATVIESNGILNAANRTIIGLPIYGEPVVNANLTRSDKFATFLDGDTDLICEEGNPVAEAFSIGDCVTLYGRYWKITNVFNIHNVKHLIIEVTEEPADVETSDNITGVLRGVDTSINKSTNTTDDLELLVYNNSRPMKGNVVNYYSSDTTVATIDKSTGHISYIAEGTVTFTAEVANISGFYKTLTVTIDNDEDSSGYAIYWDTETLVYQGLDNDISCYVAHGGKVDNTVSLNYRITAYTLDSKYLDKITLTAITGGVRINMNCPYIYGKTVTVEAYNTEHNISATKTFTIYDYI